MTTQSGGSSSHSTPANRHALLAISLGLAAALALSVIPTAWATGAAAPLNQTVPTPEPPPPPPPPPAPAPSNAGGGGGGGAPAAPQEANAPVDVRLGPGDGVYLMPRPDNGCIQINVSALPAQLLFQISPMVPAAAPSLPAGYRATSAVYVLKVWSGQTGQEVSEISPDYTHTVCYTEADLAAAGGDPNNFVLAYYDETARTWVDLTSVTIDAINRHVVGQTNHASWWALLVREGAPAPVTLPETGNAPEVVPTLALAGLLLLVAGGWVGFRGAVR